MRLRRIVGFLAASFASSLLFFAVLVLGGIFLRGQYGGSVTRDDGFAVLTWTVIGWPVVAVVALFPAIVFVRYGERAGMGNPLFYGLAGLASALLPALAWMFVQLSSGGDMGLAGLAGAALLVSGAFGGLVYWLMAGRMANSRAAITE